MSCTAGTRTRGSCRTVQKHVPMSHIGFSRPDGSSAAVVLQDNCMKVRKSLIAPEARSSSTVQTPLYQFRSLTALKYIPAPRFQTDFATSYNFPHRPSTGWYGTPKRTDLVKDTQFCLQVNDGTVCKCRCPEDQHMRPDGFVLSTCVCDWTLMELDTLTHSERK
jgi:hypothetical protein